MLDRMLGDFAIETYVLATAVMRGQIQAPARKPVSGEDAASAALIPIIGPTIRERLDAAIWLAEQRNGKSRISTDIEITGSVGVAMHLDPSTLTDAELEFLERIGQKALEPPQKAIIDQVTAETENAGNDHESD
jgi:hypothetical protein